MKTNKTFKIIISLVLTIIMCCSVITGVTTMYGVAADISLDVTPVPTVDVSATVEPIPTPIADPVYPFTVKQKTLYPKKMKITGTLSQNEPPTPTTMVVSVNSIEILRKELPFGKTYSMTVDFSDYNIGDSVAFKRVASDGSFSLSMSHIFKIKRQQLKIPKKTAIKKIKKLGKGKVKVFLKKVKNVSGYKVSCATNKKFKGKGTKVKTAKTNTVVIKGLKAGKYFVKAQTYNACKGSKTKYSKASKIKKVSVR